jgi:hypothetical protein
MENSNLVYPLASAYPADRRRRPVNDDAYLAANRYDRKRRHFQTETEAPAGFRAIVLTGAIVLLCCSLVPLAPLLLLASA